MYLKQGGPRGVILKEPYGGKGVEPEDELAGEILELVKQQNEY
jgi:hypothetical protein